MITEYKTLIIASSTFSTTCQLLLRCLWKYLQVCFLGRFYCYHLLILSRMERGMRFSAILGWATYNIAIEYSSYKRTLCRTCGRWDQKELFNNNKIPKLLYPLTYKIMLLFSPSKLRIVSLHFITHIRICYAQDKWYRYCFSQI